jgi:hypothetical protein
VDTIQTEESSEDILLVLPGKHKLSDSDDRDDTTTHDNEQMQIGGLSRKPSWQDTGTSDATHEMLLYYFWTIVCY